jgi:thiol-disulfide isomerase/thioredoxin
MQIPRQSLIALALAFLVLPLAAEDREPAKDADSGKKEAAKEKQLTVGTKVGHRIPQFKAELWDVSGEKVAKSAFDSHANDSATAFVFMSRTCPYCRQYQERLAKMSKTFKDKNVRFVMVYPTRKTAAEKKIAYHKSAGFDGPMVNDKDASIVKALGITKTPEIVLVSKKGEIVYRGGIDDNPRHESKVKTHSLRIACDDVAAGRKVSVTAAPLYG